MGIGSVIVLDTHVWVWWVHGDAQLPRQMAADVTAHEGDQIGVSVISCWEVAKLVEHGRMTLPVPIDEWMASALAYPGVELLALTPEIAIASTQLPGTFHKDPADQIIVATARVLDSALVTLDAKVRAYPYVKLLQ
jgi:PIN domain nuclease of toxin-antitoxin system